jgi:hypothetical protein
LSRARIQRAFERLEAAALEHLASAPLDRSGQGASAGPHRDL